MAIALHHSKATGAAKLALVGIGNHDGDGGAWPSVKTLSRYSHTDARSTQRQIDKLIALGEVEKVQNGGGNRYTADHERPNLYRFILTCPPNCDRSKNHNICGACGDPRYSSQRFTCAECSAVDNTGTDPMVGQPPRGSGTTRPMVGQPPRPMVGQPPEPSLEPPLNSDGSFPSTSPERAAVCWACGQPRCINGARYCKQCINSGLNTPMIECTGCGAAGRRHTPGQQHFTCGSCRHDEPPQEAFDHEGANHHAV